MLSNGRCIGSTGRLSGADMENAYSGMQQQWTDKTGVLPAAWDLREKLLLLAPEAPRSDGRSCRASDRAAGISGDLNGDSSDPIPGCRIEAAGRCGY